jgi:chromosome segregation protein
MLKRLELVGFKSFADRTRFDFAPGITGVVGPNGSGKSNVVDAVRWILGEQSAKSLRGGEMADVIFNGSSSRKSLGLAEVTVTLDNSRRLLAVDADEVELTRRVYRDGTGEYLINGTIARLKDFKEMFLGSGAGANGYTIIAQGRVDELLQASTKDRREIFDEAAGISRFKARKAETLRKLAAVEINLTRSRDRLDSIGTQLRTLRIQAAKAQKYREYSDRLRDLRVGLGAREYRVLTTSLETERRALAELQADVADANRQADELEETLRELDRSVSRTEDGLRHQEGRLADARQQIAAHESTLKHERSAAAEHESELLRIGRQRAELGARTRLIEADAARAAMEASAAEESLGVERNAADSAAAVLAEAAERVAALDRTIAEHRERQFQLVGEAATARSSASASLAQVERLQKEYARKHSEIEQSASRRAAQAEVLDGLSRADADVQARLGDARLRLRRHQIDRDELADRIGRVQASLESLRVRQGDLHGRVTVLEDLERALDGLGAGVRHVLERLNAQRASRKLPAQESDVIAPHASRDNFVDIVGLVADLLRVPHEIAPLVELVLGDSAQRFVIRSLDVATLVRRMGELPGRVGFIPYRETVIQRRDAGDRRDERLLASWVECELPGLPEQLLGTTIVGESLEEAHQLHLAYPGYRVVTRRGEILEPDGTLIVGPPRTEAGLVSRKSELRELRAQSFALTQQIEITTVELAELHRRADTADGTIEAVDSEIELLSGESGDLQQKIARQRQQVELLDETIELACRERDILEEDVRSSEAAWVSAKLAAEEAERAEEELRARLADSEEALRRAEQDRDAAQETNTAALVALSRAAADRDRTRDRAAALEVDLRKRRVEAVDLLAADRTTRARLADCTLAVLNASAGQAEAYREKEHREGLIAELATKAELDRTARERVRDELQALRANWQERQTQAHARELTVQNLDSRREAIAQRLREDYAIELAGVIEAMQTEPTPESGSRGEEFESPAAGSDQSHCPHRFAAEISTEEAQTQIEELRKKLTRLGSVNMEALEELTRIETEHDALQAQHDDLIQARKSLEDVIDAINTDSRKLFTDTLATIRGHFQELFRKLFGGGQADVVLEDGLDVLESGIEIIARPPGKDLRSLSLLSGGEKTLSAIALLLAIFRSKPSPFCILDEVDAALDEANTTRLAGVLREFLDQSQFIVVTHKKRTMAAADRLWGVTMLESGVSRLLPMRFEDWPDEEPAQVAEDEQAA